MTDARAVRGAETRPSPAMAYWVAAVLGSLHAAPSVYWALGGTWMLESVGQWAVELASEHPGLVFGALMMIAVLKLAAAWIPLLAEVGRIPWRGLWRAVSWCGAIGLILYGGANIILSSAALAGWVTVADMDRTALAGHALLWGPLFLLWGAALLAALVTSYRRRRGD